MAKIDDPLLIAPEYWVERRAEAGFPFDPDASLPSGKCRSCIRVSARSGSRPAPTLATGVAHARARRGVASGPEELQEQGHAKPRQGCRKNVDGFVLLKQM